MKKNLLFILVIVFVIVAIYSQSIGFNFIFFDDDSILLNNPDFFISDFSWKQIFTTDAFIYKESSFYRPLQNVSFAFDAFLAGGIYAWSFHLTNVILFLGIGILLYFFLVTFSIEKSYALFGTLFFVANPLNVWSVVWIPSRGDLLLTFFTLLTFICYIKFLKTTKIYLLFATLISFTLALFSKETAALIPFLLFALFFINKHKEPQNCPKEILSSPLRPPRIPPRNPLRPLRENLRSLRLNSSFLLFLLMFGIGLIWFYLRSNAIIHLELLISTKDFFYNLLNIPTLFSQFFIPYEMSPFPAFTVTKTIIGFLILIVLLILTFRNKKLPLLEQLFCRGWVILFLFPIFFVKFRNIDYFEHRYLLPQIGILLFILILMRFIKNKNQKSKIKIFSIKIHNSQFNILHLSFIILLFTFGVTSALKARTLQNPLTVVEAAVKYDGKTIVPYTNRGRFFLVNLNYDNALADYSKVISKDPNNFVAYHNCAKIFMEQQNYEQAIVYFTKSISLQSKIEGSYYNRSLAKTQLGDFEGALQDIDSAILLNNSAALLYNNRGVLRMNLGDSVGALSDFSLAIELSNYSYSDAYGNRAFVRKQLGEIEGAIEDCITALKLNPSDTEIEILLKELQ